MAYTLSNMNSAAMNSAMSQAMNMFSHYNHQEYVLQELNPLMKQPKPEPIHVQHNPVPPPPPPQNNMPHECQTCHRRFAQKQTLIQHMTTHTGIKAFQCQLCFKNFTQQGSLQRHMAIHNNERPYTCEICHKSFRQKSHLTNHAKSHVDQRMYKCNLCTKSFNRSDHCKRHMLTHSTNRPIYTCFFCNKEFKEKYLMKTHIKKKLCFHEATRTRRRRDSNEPPRERIKREKFLFQCEHCYKNFHRSTKEFSNKYLEKYCKNCCPVSESEKFTFFEEEVYICSVCNGPPFTKLKTYNRHMALHSQDRKFECEICHLRFQKKYLLRYHLNVHNNVKDYQCQLCGLQFETMIKLRDHYCHHVEHAEYLATIMKIYQCHHCSKLFVRRTNCVKHVRSHMNLPRRPKGPRPNNQQNLKEEDENEDLTKPNIGRVVRTASNNRVVDVDEYDHFLSKNNSAGANDEDDDLYMGGDDHSYDEDSTQATSDSKNFNNQQGSGGNYYQQFNNYYCNKSGEGANENQQQMYQQNNQYNQSGNNQNYDGFNNMMVNQNGNQAPSQTGQIPISSLPFANTSNNIQAYGPVEIEHHDIEDLIITSKPRDDDSNPAPFHCYVCKKKYRHKKQLVRHFQVNHTNDYDRVICDICNKEFTHKSSLVEHKLLHLPPKHECPVCQKRFNRKYSLKRHMLLHKGERPFHCTQCSASFNHKKSLEIHLLKHQGILPFECNICNKRYVDKGTLSRHYLVHSGERKFVCHLCDLRFSQKIHLSKHYLTHDEIEKKLILDCHVCGKKFYTKFNFSRHLETHNKKRSVKCDMCDKTFKFENGFQRHLEKGKCKGKTATMKRSGSRKQRRKKKVQVTSDEETSEDSMIVRKRRKQKKMKKKRRKKRKHVTSSEEEEEEDYDEEEEGEGEELPLEIKAEAEENNEVEEEERDVKNVAHINPDYSENFDSEVEELSSNKRLKVKSEMSTGVPFSHAQFSEAPAPHAISEAYNEDQYIVPNIIQTQQFTMGQQFPAQVEPFSSNPNFSEQHAALSTDWTA
ncbi:hypothetical protein M8J75_015002 [Diaphorina citri]|nr:hypothetical protein M8J75_015002 [Diaphorina citri]KAI5748428.1 hypothetical protein M8J77_025432 [Diaphorina citri]